MILSTVTVATWSFISTLKSGVKGSVVDGLMLSSLESDCMEVNHRHEEGCIGGMSRLAILRRPEEMIIGDSVSRRIQ